MTRAMEHCDVSPAVAGGFLTTALPGKSLYVQFDNGLISPDVILSAFSHTL